MTSRLPIYLTVCAGLFGLAISLTSVHAQLTQEEAALQLQLNSITTAVPFLNIAPDSRSSGLGDAGVALSPDGSSLHWNPAQMAFSESEFEMNLGYAPWLRALVNDMSIAYVGGYRKLNDRQAFGAALRYFSLGDITFTDVTGQAIRDFSPSEFSLDFGFSQKLSNTWSGGVAARYIHSNLTGGTNVLGADSRPGRSAAVDIGVFHTNNKVSYGDKDGIFNWGLSISNIGAKMSYTESAKRDFIPTNLRTGIAMTMLMDDYNSLTFTVDANKLLVPSAPVYDQNDRDEIVSGFNPDVGVATGMIQSFYDAPGLVTQNLDGTYNIEPGSILKEEMREINLGGGLEYDFNGVFAFRGGYFYEHYTKGNRQFITLGAGMKYTVFTVDMSYLISTTQQNPLEGTLRFTMRMSFDGLDLADDPGNL